MEYQWKLMVISIFGDITQDVMSCLRAGYRCKLRLPFLGGNWWLGLCNQQEFRSKKGKKTSPFHSSYQKCAKMMTLMLNEVNCNNSKCFSLLSYLVQNQRTIMGLNKVLVAQNLLVPKLCKMKPLSCTWRKLSRLRKLRHEVLTKQNHLNSYYFL